jgi:hypothetical protein
MFPLAAHESNFVPFQTGGFFPEKQNKLLGLYSASELYRLFVRRGQRNSADFWG